MTQFTVGQVAALSGVSVRTLHHYDEVGLLTPRDRTAGGYRQYDADDLTRLRRILYYRELDFGLDEIAQILDDDVTAEDHLRRQHRLLRERVERQHRLLEALETEMEARAMGIGMTPQESFEVFGTDKVAGEWAEEAEQRWGDTDAYRESQRRAATYSKQDWVEMKTQSDAATQAFAAALREGAPSDGDRATTVAEEHRQFLTRWFYDCDYAMHLGLAEMYICDARFTATYDDITPGLAQYVHDAIVANVARHTAP